MRKAIITLSALLTFCAEAEDYYRLDHCKASGTSSAVLVGQKEPGARITVTGSVIDGRTRKPMAGISVRAFQADATGRYAPDGGDNRRPRLCATAKTDANGRYSFQTIKPGSYPDSRNPAHIHFEIWGSGVEKQHAELRFEGDPYLEPGQKAGDRTSVVRPINKNVVERDLVVRR